MNLEGVSIYIMTFVVISLLLLIGLFDVILCFLEHFVSTFSRIVNASFCNFWNADFEALILGVLNSFKKIVA